ncbi:PAS domain-containing protein [Rhodospirillaceae bacterium KN72]|uniref:PAS domain-containing protein n=1 Tax=Pacificispira spongiicola TaxID=2729598 RepID=A0A7Y0DYJ8_9PROT|nr:PAS domain-containing protein [Pacificispira spongiicola]NMM43848.1 PAS domain-containing protein [Pacificispira spongiicola]
MPDAPSNSIPSPSSPPGVRAVFDYWIGIRAARHLPLRADFDPMAIRKHLPSVLLVDIEGLTNDGTGIYRYRLAGEREIQARGVNPKGRLVTEAYYGPAADVSIANFETVRTTCAPHFIVLEFVNDRGLRVNEESVLLPFSEDGQTVSQILVFSEERR